MPINEITTPFNFVPLPNTVFFPGWASLVSQDAPFRNGVSGSLKIKLTAQSPIFVRNGNLDKRNKGNQEDRRENQEANRFCNRVVDGKREFFIPGTSVKGAIRSVLEIVSFGKLRTDATKAYAQREWNNSSLWPLKEWQRKAGMMKAGWLRRRDGLYVIDECDFYRISQQEIQRMFPQLGDVFDVVFSEDALVTHNGEPKKLGDEQKSAAFKYQLLRERGVEKADLEHLLFDRLNERDNRNLKVKKGNKLKGTIVLTGQPGLAEWKMENRTGNKAAGKFYEFVFLDQSSRSYKLSEEMFNLYKDNVYSGDSKAVWDEWSKDMKKGIPVFFRLGDNQYPNFKDSEINSFGLALLYKLPYRFSPIEVERKRYGGKENEMSDLADCMFGYVNDAKNPRMETALKGRVLFSDFVAKSGVQEMDDFDLILNSPKASYYPMYIEQLNNGNPYNTLNDGKLSGWKRYILQDLTVERLKETSDEVRRMEGYTTLSSIVKPLKAGVVFEGEVHFHNLRVVEYGALLSALTHHKNSGCFHQIGQGKPFGLGMVKLEVEVGAKEVLAMAHFEARMEKETGNQWLQSSTMTEFFAMAGEVIKDTARLKYMHMDNDPSRNDFANAKDAHLVLDRFTKKFGINQKGSHSVLAQCSNSERKEIEEMETEDWLKYRDLAIQLDHDVREANKKAEQEENELHAAELAHIKYLEEEKAKQAEEAKLAERALEEKLAEERQRLIEAEEAKLKAAAEEKEKDRLKRLEEMKAEGLSFLNGLDDYKKGMNEIKNYVRKTKKKVCGDDIAILKDFMLCFRNSESTQEKEWKGKNSKYLKFLNEVVEKTEVAALWNAICLE